MLRCALTTPATRLRPRTSIASTSGLGERTLDRPQSTGRPSQTRRAEGNQRGIVRPIGQCPISAARRTRARLTATRAARTDACRADRRFPDSRARARPARRSARGPTRRSRCSASSYRREQLSRPTASSSGEDRRAGSSIESAGWPAGAGPAHGVPEPVAERLTDVGAERALVLGRERLELRNGTDQRILDDVLGVEVLARPDRQPAVRPAPQARKVARAQLVLCPFVSLLRPENKNQRGVGGRYVPGGTPRSRNGIQRIHGMISRQ